MEVSNLVLKEVSERCAPMLEDYERTTLKDSTQVSHESLRKILDCYSLLAGRNPFVSSLG